MKRKPNKSAASLKWFRAQDQGYIDELGARLVLVRDLADKCLDSDDNHKAGLSEILAAMISLERHIKNSKGVGVK